MSVDPAREIALKTLYDINDKGAYSNIALNRHLESADLRDVDRAFITDLVYGTVKWRLALDHVIAQFSSVRLGKISPWILNVLRLGVYQLLHTDRIPVSAACNESVNLSKKYGHAASAGFVNAVLRNIARSRDKIRYPEMENEYSRYLSVKYSYPEWLVEKWLALYGKDFTAELLDSGNIPPDFTVRVNSLRTSKEQLKRMLKEEGIEAENGRYLEESIVISNPSGALKTEAYKNGLFQVQDESSMLVGRILGSKPGEVVMDVCSAPGGKATHIAQMMGDDGTVVARDIHPHKIKLIEDAYLRLGLKSVKAELYDATVVDENYIEKADRVLVDAPCTGLGIIRRKPDIKWARDTQDTKEIVKLQTEILSAASRYVKPGGILIYSTCTINPEENQEMVKAFINSGSSFEADDISGLLPEGLAADGPNRCCIQLFPNVHRVDGFFIARMKRVKSDA